MSQFRNAPAIRKILRTLASADSLTGKEIRARSGIDVKRRQRERLVTAGLVTAEPAGRSFTYTLTELGIAYLRDELGETTAPRRPATPRLSDKERIALFALLSPSLRVSYADVKRVFGLSIGVTIRTILQDKGLVLVSERPAISFELTDIGWKTAEDELSYPGDADDPPLLKLLHHHYTQLLGALRSRGLGLIDLYAEDHGAKPHLGAP